MIGQVKTINGVKTVVPLSNEVTTNSVASGNMEPITSNAVYNAINVAKGNITKIVETQGTFGSFADLQTAVLGFSGLRFDCVSLTFASGDPNAPITTPEYYWWNVITYGIPTRQCQIATQAFIGYSYTGAMYVRSYHDNRWSAWYQK